MNGKLILARHHESEWNKLGKWTGTRDRHLTDVGFKNSAAMGLLIENIPIEQAFASMQVRSIETLSCMLNTCNWLEVPTEHSAALNERDYGDYTGKNKWEMEKLLGPEEFKKLRRGWDYPIPHGESLSAVYDRTIPYFLEKVLPSVRAGKNTLVVAHGNSLRSIVKYIEGISDEGIVDVEFPFGAVVIYDVDDEGRMVAKEVREITDDAALASPQVVATVGPVSSTRAMIEAMLRAGVDVIRINFSWGGIEEHREQISIVRDIAQALGKKVPIIADLPGPRVQTGGEHSFDAAAAAIPTKEDAAFIAYVATEGIEYIAASFVGSADDVKKYKEAIASAGGTQKIIAKIERAEAVTAIDGIIEASDAVMIARGDLGSAVPLEQIPFIQSDIVQRCNTAGKPVIVATQMMLSMTDHDEPTRAEVSDVADAVVEGADAVMLSEETARGHYPTEASAMMEKIVAEARKHTAKSTPTHPL